MKKTLGFTGAILSLAAIAAISASRLAAQSAPPAPGTTRPSAAAPVDTSSSKDAFVRSLTWRADRIIADSSHPMLLWLGQSSAVAYRPSSTVKLKLTLAGPAADSAPIKALGSFDITPRDLSSRPFAVPAEFDGVPDGNYRLVASITEGDAPLASLEQSIWLVKGIDARRGDIVDRLAKISGHDGTKATIMYPFDVARTVNTGRRGYNAADLGIDEKSQTNYLDFSAAMKRSDDLLAALEAGKDPLWQAKGETERHYYFTEGDEIMPYHVFVPPTWDGKTPLPMVFILHGNTRNQDFYFDRNDRIIPKLAEKHGFMLVGVFGYHPNGGYNLSAMPGGAGRGGRGGGAAPAFGPAGGRGRGGAPSMGGMPQSRITELSEIDTMHVYDLVTKEYPIDPKRTFLFGYSAGGNGGYYIGGKYANNWAAIALGGAGTRLSSTYPYYDTFKQLNTPFFIYYGEKDNVGPGSQASVQALNDHGITSVLKSYPNVDHDGGPAAGAGDAFDFFDAHSRK